MNKKVAITILSSALLVGGVLVSQIEDTGSGFFAGLTKSGVANDADSRTLSISAGDVNSSDFNGGVVEKDFAGNEFGYFRFTNASYASGNVCSLGKGGEIIKLDAANGLSTVTATFSGKLTLYCADSEGSYTMRYVLVSGQSVNVEGNYIKFVAEDDGGATVNNINFVFSCFVPSGSYTHNFDTTVWEFDSNKHWHPCVDEHCIAHANESGHTLKTISSDVQPTYTAPGHKAGTYCTVCGYGAVEIPMLDEVNYTRTQTQNHNQSLTETWTLKDPSVIGQSSYVVTKALKSGFIILNDYSGAEKVSTDYTAYSFNKEFKDKGLEMSFDESKKALTFNVTKKGGYTFDKVNVSFPSKGEKNTVTITGEPLTIYAGEGCNDDGLSFWGDTSLSYLCTAVIDTDVTVIYSNDYTKTTSKNGIYESILTINSGASLKTMGFPIGITACYTPITINGFLDASGTTMGIASSNSNNRTIKINSNLDFYLNHQFKQTGGSSDTNTTKNVKHVLAIPKGSNLSNYINKTSVVAVEPTKSSVGTLNRVCECCGNLVETVELPMLSSANYDIVAEITEIGGQYYDATTYTWKNHSYGDIEIHTNKTLLDYYAVVGEDIYSANTWSAQHANCSAEEDSGNLTITLNGDVELNLGEAGGIDFTKYNQVKIEGEGTLSVTTAQKTCIKAKKLVVGENVTLDLNGTNYAAATGYYGIETTSSLDIQGTVNIDNFYGGIHGQGTCDVTGDLTITHVVWGVYANAGLTFTNYGNVNVTTATNKGIGFYEGGAYAAIFHFTGDSVTNVSSTFEGFGTNGSTTKNYNYTLRVSGNAELNVINTCNGENNSGCVHAVTNFIIENAANVYLEANGCDNLGFFSFGGVAHEFTINTTNVVTIKRGSTSKNKNGITFNNGNFAVKILSGVVLQNFTNAFYFAKNNTQFTSIDCNHMFTINNCTNNQGKAGSGVIPSNFIIGDWMAV